MNNKFAPCPTCQSFDRTLFFNLNNMPTMDGRLSDSLEEAMNTAMGDIKTGLL